MNINRTDDHTDKATQVALPNRSTVAAIAHPAQAVAAHVGRAWLVRVSPSAGCDWKGLDRTGTQRHVQLVVRFEAKRGKLQDQREEAN